MSIFWLVALALGTLLFSIYVDAQAFPKYVKFDGKRLLAVPHDQEISSLDYALSPSNAWISIRFEKKKEKNDGQ